MVYWVRMAWSYSSFVKLGDECGVSKVGSMSRTTRTTIKVEVEEQKIAGAGR